MPALDICLSCSCSSKLSADDSATHQHQQWATEPIKPHPMMSSYTCFEFAAQAPCSAGWGLFLMMNVDVGAASAAGRALGCGKFPGGGDVLSVIDML